MHGYLALDALVERDECLGRHHTRNHLHLVVEQIHEMLVVAGIHLEEHGVGTSGEVALHNFGNIDELLYHVLIHVASLEVHAYISACAIADALGVNIETATLYHTASNEMLNALVDCRTRHASLSGYILEWYTCIL